MRNETLDRFLERLGSTEPAPGGGGAAAVTTAMAAALVEMAAGLSTDQVEDAAAVAAAASDIRRRALTLADADAAAYGQVLAAYRRPKDGDAEARRGAIRQALEEATAVPLEIAGLAADVAELGGRLVAGGNPNLEGDAAAAVFLARAGARAAARLVEINVAAGKLDGDWCDRATVSVARAEAARPTTG